MEKISDFCIFQALILHQKRRMNRETEAQDISWPQMGLLGQRRSRARASTRKEAAVQTGRVRSPDAFSHSARFGYGKSIMIVL